MSPLPPPETNSSYTRSSSHRRPPRSSPRASPTPSLQSDDTSGGGGSATFAVSYERQQQERPKRKPSSSRRRRSTSFRKGRDVHSSSVLVVDNVANYDYREGGVFDDDKLNYSSASSSSSLSEFFIDHDHGEDGRTGGRRRRKTNDSTRDFRSSSLPSSFDERERSAPVSDSHEDRYDVFDQFGNHSFPSRDKKSLRFEKEERAAAAAAAAALNNQLEAIDTETKKVSKSCRSNSRTPRSFDEGDIIANVNENFEKSHHRSRSSTYDDNFKKIHHRSKSSAYGDTIGEAGGSRNRANTDPVTTATAAFSSNELGANKVRKGWRRSPSQKSLISRSPPPPRSFINNDIDEHNNDKIPNRSKSGSYHDKVEEIRSRRNRADTDPFPSSTTHSKTEKKAKKRELKQHQSPESAPSIDALDGSGSNSFDYFFPSNLHHPAAAVKHSKYERTESNASSDSNMSPSQMGYYDDIFAAATHHHHDYDEDKLHSDKKESKKVRCDDDDESIVLPQREKDDEVVDDDFANFLGSHPLLDDDPIRRNIIEGKYKDDDDIDDDDNNDDNDEAENDTFENKMIENKPTSKEEKKEEKEGKLGHLISPMSTNSLAASLTKWISPTAKVVTPDMYDDNQLSSPDNDHRRVDINNSFGLADDEQSFNSCSSISSAASIMTGTIQTVADDNDDDKKEKEDSKKDDHEEEELFYDAESYMGDEENETKMSNLLPLPPPSPAPSPFPSYTPFLPPYLSSPFPSHEPLFLDTIYNEGDGISPLPSPMVKKASRKLFGAPQCSFSLLGEDTTEGNGVSSKHDVDSDNEPNGITNKGKSSSLSATLKSTNEKSSSDPEQKKSVSFSSPFSTSQRRLAGVDKNSAQSHPNSNSVSPSQSSTTSSRVSLPSKQKSTKIRMPRLFSSLSLRNIRKNRSLSPQRRSTMSLSLRSSGGRGGDAGHYDGKDNDISCSDSSMLLPLHEESGDELYIYEKEEDASDYEFTNRSMSKIHSPRVDLPIISEETISQREKKKKHHTSLQRMYGSIARMQDSTHCELSVTSSAGPEVCGDKKIKGRWMTSVLSRRPITMKNGTPLPGSSSSLPDLSRQSSRSVDSSTQSLHERLGAQRRIAPKRTLMDTSTTSQDLHDSQSLSDGESFLTSQSRSFHHLDSEASDLASFSTARSRSYLYPENRMRRKTAVRPELLEDDYDDYFDEIRDILSDCDSDKSIHGDDSKHVTNSSNASDTQASRGSSAFFRTFHDIKTSIINSSVVFQGADRRSTMEDRQRKKISRETAFDLLKIRMKRREEAAVTVLRSKHGFPTGLARVCYRVSLHYLPLRIWVVDNSGSMSMGDGRRFLDGNKNVAAGRKAGRVSQMINCTRWEELRDSVLFHAEMASDLGAPTMFRLLNNPNIALKAQNEYVISDDESCDEDTYKLPQVVGVCARKNDELDPKKVNERGRKEGGILTKFSGRVNHRRIGDGADDDEEKYDWEGMWEVDLGALDDTDFDWMNRAQDDLELVTSVMYEVEPRYKTPLTHHIWAIYDQVKHMKKYLRPNQKVAIVIATDGLPDEHVVFLSAMRMMQKLPVYIIVRLCTDDEAAMHFWQTLDLDLNILVEVLDDFESEAHQVYSMNPWITYSLPLQRIREWGYRSEILEKLRERPLTIEEVRDCCAMIFGVPSSTLCDPETDWLGFREDIDALASNESRQWHPVLRKTKRWINMDKLGDMYGGKAEKKRRKMLRKQEREKKMQEKKRKQELRSQRKKDQQRAKGHSRMDNMNLRKKRLQLAASVRHLSTVAQSAVQ